MQLKSMTSLVKKHLIGVEKHDNLYENLLKSHKGPKSMTSLISKSRNGPKSITSHKQIMYQKAYKLSLWDSHTKRMHPKA